MKETTVSYSGFITDDLWTARIEGGFENLFGLNIGDVAFIPELQKKNKKRTELKEPISIKAVRCLLLPGSDASVDNVLVWTEYIRAGTQKPRI